MDKTVQLVTDVSLTDVVNSVTSLPHDELIQFIHQVDLEVADYDFTKKLRNHIIKELEQEMGVEMDIPGTGSVKAHESVTNVNGEVVDCLVVNVNGTTFVVEGDFDICDMDMSDFEKIITKNLDK